MSPENGVLLAWGALVAASLTVGLLLARSWWGGRAKPRSGGPGAKKPLAHSAGIRVVCVQVHFVVCGGMLELSNL